jgi:hypothetical protein
MALILDRWMKIEENERNKKVGLSDDGKTERFKK